MDAEGLKEWIGMPMPMEVKEGWQIDGRSINKRRHERVVMEAEDRFGDRRYETSMSGVEG